MPAASSTHPKVLVLLAVFNGERWLPDQLESLRTQQGVELTVLAHDDGSSDGSLALLRQVQGQWQDRGAATNYLEVPGPDPFGAPAAAHRAVLESARLNTAEVSQCADALLGRPTLDLLPPCARWGAAAQSFLHLLREADLSAVDYVALADQDDLWHASKLERAVKTLHSTGASGYSSNVCAFWPDGRRLILNKAQAQRPWDYLFEAAGPGCTYVIDVLTARRFQAWLRQNRAKTDSIRFHDWLLYAWVRSQGLQWAIDPCSSMDYRQHNSNEVGANQGVRAAWRRARRVFNGFAFEQVRVVAQCLGASEQQFVAQTLGAGRLGMLRLAWRARQCRRRVRDQWLMAGLCGAMALLSAAGDRTSGRRPAGG